MCSFWEDDNFRDRGEFANSAKDDNFRDRGEFANSATDGCFSGVSHPEISDESYSFK